MPRTWSRIGILLLILGALGCARSFRKESARNLDPVRPIPAAVPALMTRTEPPAAPAPSPVQLVAPPKPELHSGNVPPLPDANAVLQAASERAKSEIVTASAAEPEEKPERRPLRERLEQRREEKKTPAEEPRPLPEKSTLPPLPSPGDTKATLAPTPPPVADPKADDLRAFITDAEKRWNEITDYEATLVKREVVNGKSMPTEEMNYRLRKKPFSVYLKVTGDSGRGREVLFIDGANNNKMTVVTGKGDNALVGAGYKTELDPDSRTATAKNRHRIYEGGFGKTFVLLHKALDARSSGKSSPAIKKIGEVQRNEYDRPLMVFEVKLGPGDDPLLPQGGIKTIGFDAKKESPSHMLPIFSTLKDHEGREVEYYKFDKFKIPSGATDDDWNPARLGRK